MCPTLSHDSLIKEPGAMHTASEIAGQPELWGKIYRQVVNEEKLISAFLNQALPDISRVILTGAGTSAFIGLSLHGLYSRSLKIHTDAVPTTDLVTHPSDHFLSHESIMLVSFARSGNSPESKAVLELADKLCKKCYHLVITCDSSGMLAKHSSDSKKYIIVLPSEANDRGLAMTGSYSGMLLCGILVADLKKIENLRTQIDKLRSYGNKIIEQYASPLKEVVSLKFSRVVFLGSGPFFGTATESQLKLQELTDGNIICKTDSYLGFRHGPKAVTDEKTLIVFIFSSNPFVQQYERDLVKSMRKGKTPLFTIGVSEKKIKGLKMDLEIILSESANHIDEELLTVCAILPGQFLGFYKSLSLGLNPDSPSESGAISRVVEDVTIYNY